ncbi:MAG: hypothetical protein E4G96_01640 [Chrysiogenales bacterium]|nr:MAG: hypothetical protein E4G96_01640 [Chrysiogenales bacterium]
MAVTPILTSQLRKITTFIYILILLLIINVVFNLMFKWDVIPVIVNVYLYVFSFYLIFNFSLIEIPPLKEEYRIAYPKFGDLILFFKTRVVPFLLIYAITVIYTLINYLDVGNWPWRPVLELLDGRFSNTVFYSLILLLILKLNRRPKITLLLFVVGAALYFLIYQMVFMFSPSGAVMSGIKFFQIALALSVIVYEFASDRFVIEKKRIQKSILAGLLMGVCMYSFFVGTLSMIYRFQRFASYQQARAGQILMRLGYTFPLKDFKSIVTATSDPYLLYDLIYYSRQYHRPLLISSTEWENLMISGSMEVANIISFYLQILGVEISYNQIISYAERRSNDSGETLLNSSFYIRYASRYCLEHIKDMIKRYHGGNRYFKLWIVRVSGESNCMEAIPFLITLLTDIDPAFSQEAYAALSKITGLDPAKELDIRVNDPRVIVEFDGFYRRSHNSG